MEEAYVDRRLAAIVVADFVGYSSLVERNEASTLAALAVLRDEVLMPAIAGYRGRLVKFLGDGFLIEFGSVVDAVNCAVALQRRCRATQVDVAESERQT